MKIFNIENGKKKVYVQLNDIAMLDEFADVIPASIMDMMYQRTIIVNDSNRMNFIEFTERDEVAFFESQEWILDYKKVRDLSIEELSSMGQTILDEMNDVAASYNSLPLADRMNHSDLESRHEILRYQLNYITEMVSLKRGTTIMPFPVIPDSDGFTFVGDSAVNYTIKGSLDPNKFLLFRTDGNPISDKERVPQGFLQSGIAIALVDKRIEHNFYGEYEMRYSMSGDNKFLIIEFKVKSLTPPTPKNPEEKGLMKLVNRLLGKKK